MTQPLQARRRWALIVAALVGLGFVSCESPPPPNVLWIVWDTVRADRMGVYGHDKPTTPNVDRWAQGARVYDNCLSTAGYTLPSHASMFTGLLPSEHCVNNDNQNLADRYETIAEILESFGYRTYIFSANPNISKRANFTQGFDGVEHPWHPRFRETAMRIVRHKLEAEDRSSELNDVFRKTADDDDARMSIWNIKATGVLAQEGLVSWLRSKNRSKRPYFAFLNYMEAHRPLIPERKYRERVMTPEEVERSYTVNRSWRPTWEYTFGLREFDDEELELTRATYDAALAELDSLFARLITTLKNGGWLDNTVVILTSDHGEHLGEQHMLDHQYSVYQPLLRVPMIVHYPPRFEPGRDSSPVMNHDLFPTILDVVGVSHPAGQHLEAVSLLEPRQDRLRLAEDPSPSPVALATIKLDHPDWDPEPWKRQLRALVDGEHKLIWGSDGRHELFDIGSDPWETHDLLEQRDDLATRMQDTLEEYRGGLQLCTPSKKPQDMTPEQIRRLRALGYLGG